jgi:hypothetical protein
MGPRFADLAPGKPGTGRECDSAVPSSVAPGSEPGNWKVSIRLRHIPRVINLGARAGVARRRSTSSRTRSSDVLPTPTGVIIADNARKIWVIYTLRRHEAQRWDEPE